MRKNYSKAFKTLLLSCVDNSGYSEVELKTDKEKELFLVETFKSEMHWKIKHGEGIFNTADSWLRGLAGACSVPYWNDEIKEFMKSIEYTVVKDENLVVNHYWDRMANEVCKLYLKHKI
jgi:hypothetical protein